MDTWKYYDITHRNHVVCNPLSELKFNQLIDVLRLEPGSRVLDMAMGKGEFILRLAERYQISGVGIDVSPYCVAEVQKKVQQRVPAAKIQLLEMNGADYHPDPVDQFHVAACIGADWIYGGFESTLRAMKEMAVPGGWVIVGTPYWLKPPSEAYLKATGARRGDYTDFGRNVPAAREIGLSLAYMLVSNHDEWDHYEGQQWYAAMRYAQENPDDPDCAELQTRVEKFKQLYLNWERDTVGWVLYVFQKRAD